MNVTLRNNQLVRNNKEVRSFISIIPVGTLGILYAKQEIKNDIALVMLHDPNGDGLEAFKYVPTFDMNDISIVPVEELPLLLGIHDYIDSCIAEVFKN